MAKEDDRRRLFDSWADSYAAGYSGDSPDSHFFITRLSHIATSVSVPAGSRVLDVGCGPGMTADLLSKRGVSFYGVDLSQKMIRACRSRVGRLDACHLAVGRIEQLPFDDGCFDACICTGVLEYVDDTHLAMRELARVMKPEGEVVFSLWNKLSPYRMTQNLRSCVSGQALHERSFTERQGRDLAHQAGLEVTDLLYFDFNIFLPPLDRMLPGWSVRTSRRLEFLRRSIAKRIGTDMLVKAQKTDRPVLSRRSTEDRRDRSAPPFAPRGSAGQEGRRAEVVEDLPDRELIGQEGDHLHLH
jgi:ubiquinone/menaquinone biosynthesis C-methylase UbiE